MRKTAFLALLVILWGSPAVAQWVPVAEKKGFGQHLDATSDAVFVGHPAKTYTPGQVFVFTKNQQGSWAQRDVLEADELQGKAGRTRTIVWDMSDLDTPTVANQLLLSEPSSDHNLYVKGDRMYQSNYKSGLRVLDISNPEQPEEIGHFDPFPPSSPPGFEGTWSNYPYFESGIVVTSTYDGGLFVLEPSQPEL